MEDLADPARQIAGVLERLRQGDDIGQGDAEARRKVVDLGPLGVATGEEGAAGRVAERELGVGLLEADAAGREGVHVRRTRHLVTVAAESRRQVVDDDEEHVGSVGAGAGGGEEP